MCVQPVVIERMNTYFVLLSMWCFFSHIVTAMPSNLPCPGNRVIDIFWVVRLSMTLVFKKYFMSFIWFFVSSIIGWLIPHLCCSNFARSIILLVCTPQAIGSLQKPNHSVPLLLKSNKNEQKVSPVVGVLW